MIILVILTIATLVALGNFLLMVVLGAVSHIFDAPVLALSFWETMVVSIALSLVDSFFRGSK